MAGKAMVLKDTNDLFVETDPGSNRFVRAGRVSGEQESHQEAQEAQNQKSIRAFCISLWHQWPDFVSVAFVAGGGLS
jgi:hypothetical protein